MKPLAIRSILVAADLETDMVPALQSIIALSELAGSEMHIVHAGIAAPDDKRINAKINDLQAALGREIGVSVLAGPPASTITQEAARTGADVIVLGRHRNRAGAPGSTADRVVRTSRIPCLILPQALALPLTSVVVPVDINHVAGPLDVALTWASALRRRASGSDGSPTFVDVLHVDVGGSGEETKMQARLQDEVSAIRRQLGDIALVEIRQHMVHHRDVAAAIRDHAERAGAGLLVLGTRARRIESDPLGSVSSAVAMHAARPVLLVPPEHWQSRSQ